MSLPVKLVGVYKYFTLGLPNEVHGLGKHDHDYDMHVSWIKCPIFGDHDMKPNQSNRDERDQIDVEFLLLIFLELQRDEIKSNYNGIQDDEFVESQKNIMHEKTD